MLYPAFFCLLATTPVHLQREPDLIVPTPPTYMLSLPRTSEIVISDASASAQGLLVITPTGSAARRLGDPNALAGPTGLAMRDNHTGEILVGEQGRGRLARLSNVSGAVLGHLDDGLVRAPLDIISSAGRLFVSDVCYRKVGSGEQAECIGRVVIYNARTLQHVRTIDSAVLPAGERFHPHGLATIPGAAGNGRLFVADADSGCLWLFSFRGKLLQRIGTKGTDAMQFVHPRGLLLVAAADQAADARRGGHFLVVAERKRVQMLHIPGAGGGDDASIRSVQIIDFEEGSNLLGLCAVGERIFIADVGKSRLAVLRRRRNPLTTVEERENKRIELRHRQRQ